MKEILQDVPVKPFAVGLGWVLYNCDCRKVVPYLPRVDLLLTDPPYGINVTGQTLGKGQSSKPKAERFKGGDWDSKVPKYVNDLLDAAEFACVWGGNYMTSFLLPTNHWLIWHKKNDGRSFSECELAWTNYGKQCRHLSHHWSGEKKIHPTQKPLAVMRWCLGLCPQKPSTVLDPYCGSGTSLIAAVESGAVAIGCEIDEDHCRLAATRLTEAETALLVA